MVVTLLKVSQLGGEDVVKGGADVEAVEGEVFKEVVGGCGVHSGGDLPDRFAVGKRDTGGAADDEADGVVETRKELIAFE